MKFHIYESDPFVLEDLRETVASADHVEISVYPNLDDLSSASQRAEDDAVFVLSLSDVETDTSLDPVIDRIMDRKLIVIASSLPDALHKHEKFAFVRRPFTADAVLKKLTELISDPL